jgi:hypothetical protein
LEATESTDGDTVLIDTVDAPSRSKHYAKAVTTQNASLAGGDNFPCDASFVNVFMEESVAVKILNPVGFRTLSSDVTNVAVIAREGVPVDKQIYAGLRPMEEKHVWWLVNPSSRNLRTLQRYSVDGVVPTGVQVDRGCAEKGLRISLIAAFKDSDGIIKELPLTRCIEIWGHVPFEAKSRTHQQPATTKHTPIRGEISTTVVASSSSGVVPTTRLLAVLRSIHIINSSTGSVQKQQQKSTKQSWK